MAWIPPITHWGQQGQTSPGVDDFNRMEGNTQHLKDSIDTHLDDAGNPHSVTKAQVGLGNVPNYTAEQFRTASSYKLRAEVKSSAPSSPANGDIWYDSANHKFRGYANGAWV